MLWELLNKLFTRKCREQFVNKVYPKLGIDTLDASTIGMARKLAVIRNNWHPWKDMTDEELLRSTNLILMDPDTHKEGITLGAILLFGKENTIMSVLPQHRTDAIYRVENKDRYDDREVVTTNLIKSYEQLIKFGEKHLNDPFVLDGVLSVSARNAILREIVSNTLAHRDYASRFIAKLIIEEDKITVENSNIAHGIGILDLQKFKPFAKNPVISKVFREIGFADELGSGMRNTHKYTKLYSGGKPIFEEGDIFRTYIPLNKAATLKVGGDFANANVAQNVAQKNAKKVVKKSTHDNKKITMFIRKKIEENDKVTRREIAEEAKVSLKTIERAIKEIDGLEYVGSAKTGHWVFTK